MLSEHEPLCNTEEFNNMTPENRTREMWKRVKYIEDNADDVGLFKDLPIDKYPYFFWMNQMMVLTPKFGVQYLTFKSVI